MAVCGSVEESSHFHGQGPVFVLFAAELGLILYADTAQHAVTYLQYMSNQLTSAHLAFVCLAMPDTAKAKQYLCSVICVASFAACLLANSVDM